MIKKPVVGTVADPRVASLGSCGHDLPQGLVTFNLGVCCRLKWEVVPPGWGLWLLLS